jgi:hypothetical protein
MRIRTLAWVLMAGALAFAATGASQAKNAKNDHGNGKSGKARSDDGRGNGHDHDDDDDDRKGDRPELSFEARLSGFLETPLSISSAGRGKLKLRVNSAESSAEYELRYSDLEGTSVSFAHIHLGQPGTTGGVMVFLCSNTPAPVTTPACPGPEGGTVTGTLVAADVVGPSAQGIAAGEFAEFVKALRKGAAYVNVHTDLYPSGEIRGNVD